MLRAQRQFGGKGSGKKNPRQEPLTEPDMIRLHFEDDVQAEETEAITTITEEPQQKDAFTVQGLWKVSDVVVTDPEGNEITLRCASAYAMGRILTRLADCHD